MLPITRKHTHNTHKFVAYCESTPLLQKVCTQVRKVAMPPIPNTMLPIRKVCTQIWKACPLLGRLHYCQTCNVDTDHPPYILGGYNYKIVHKPGKEHANAGMPSRLPLPETPQEVPMPQGVLLLMENLHQLGFGRLGLGLIMIQHLLVRQLVSQEWKMTSNTEMQPSQNRIEELSVHHGCVLWGNRCCTTTGKQMSIGRTVHWTPWYNKDESISSQLCVVVRYG